MAIKITSECNNCGLCQPVCPYRAIYPPGSNWRADDLYSSSYGHPSEVDKFWSADIYYVVPDKCTECVGLYDEPACQSVCSLECCVSDPERFESIEHLFSKKMYLDVLASFKNLEKT